MKKKLRYVLLAVIALAVVACNRHDTPGNSEENKTVERTVIVYMVAENTLSQYARSDSAEIARGLSSIGEDYNLILYKDDAQMPSIYWMTARHGIRKWKQYTQELCSTDSTVMLRTMQDIIKAFPAHHYGLVLWSHANGWTPKVDKSQSSSQRNASPRKTFGIDNNHNTFSNTGTEMEITALKWVLRQLPRMDFILFDCCFMQNIESAYELRNVADYLIGSPSEIPGNGAPYTSIMEPMLQGNAIGIAENYFLSYQNSGGVALSVIDCLELENLAAETARYIPHIFADSIKTEGVQRFVPYDKFFSWRPEGYDMKSLMHKNMEADDFENWLKALDRAVPYRKATTQWASQWVGSHNVLTDAENYSGIAMFVPDSKYETPTNNWNKAFRHTAWYEAAAWAKTKW